MGSVTESKLCEACGKLFSFRFRADEEHPGFKYCVDCSPDGRTLKETSDAASNPPA